jgi:peptidoglycan/xylan/chitin deacetylase (PgdA/CDA1 family)
VVEWSVLSRDWTNPGVETIANRTPQQGESGAVILLHDGDGHSGRSVADQTVAATRLIIRE